MKKYIVAFLICISSLAAYANMPGTFNSLLNSRTNTCNTTRLFLTTGTTSWTNNTGCTLFTIETLGAGGSGNATGTASNRASGGGGAYSYSTNVFVGDGNTVTVSIGAGGAGVPTTTLNGNTGGDTWFNGASLALSTVGSKGGLRATSGNVEMVGLLLQELVL